MGIKASFSSSLSSNRSWQLEQGRSDSSLVSRGGGDRTSQAVSPNSLGEYREGDGEKQMNLIIIPSNSAPRRELPPAFPPGWAE